MMSLSRRRLYEDPYNIELRRYSLIETILNEKWIDLLDIIEETPYIQSYLIEYALKYLPLTMTNHERVKNLEQRFKSFQLNHLTFKNKLEISQKFIKNNQLDKCSSISSIESSDKIKNSFEMYRKQTFSSSSSSSCSSISFDQTTLFYTKAKFYKKSLNWIKIGKGECEIIENNESKEIFLRFWLLINSSIRLVLLVDLNQSENVYLSSNNSSSIMIKFKAKNQCDYPLSNHLLQYAFKFYMGILKGKDAALSHIEQSKLAFLATLSEVEQGASTHTMPPKDHYTLKFNKDTIRNLKGRVYENMKQYGYEQMGEGIPAFVNNKEDPSKCGVNATIPPVPTVGHQYVACIYDDLKVIDCLVEIDWSEVDELVKTANARRKSVV